MRVYELSKEINVPNKELVEYLSKSNSDIKTHSSSVSDAEAESARKYFAKGRNTSETKEQAPKTETPKTETPKTEKRQPERTHLKMQHRRKRFLLHIIRRTAGARK